MHRTARQLASGVLAGIVLTIGGPSLAAQAPVGTTAEAATATSKISAEVAVELRSGAETATQADAEVEVEKSKIRFGKLSDFDPARGDSVGTVRSKEIYLEITAYKRIVDERIDKKSALGRKLMAEATKAYNSALKSVANDQSLVLIVEEGGITGYSTDDVTDDVIDELPG